MLVLDNVTYNYRSSQKYKEKQKLVEMTHITSHRKVYNREQTILSNKILKCENHYYIDESVIFSAETNLLKCLHLDPELSESRCTTLQHPPVIQIHRRE